MATKPQTTTSTHLAATKKWKIIYPCYLNSKKSFNAGRKIPKEYCVENPSMQGIVEGLKSIGLPCEIEVFISIFF